MASRMKYYISALAGISLLCQSCVSESPFSEGEDGILKLSAQICEEVKTRANLADYDHESLVRNCVIYIESNKGLIRKYKGLDQVPSSISLKPGEYVVEGWTGDSVSASFDKKFYRGYERVSIASGQENQMSLVCNIANTLVSVTPESLDQGLRNVKVTFSHSKGSLEFDESRIKDGGKGYFMVPNADTSIRYLIEGNYENGDSYRQEGVINNVMRAHEYRLDLTANPDNIPFGGGVFKISIEDIEVKTELVYIYGKPTISAYINDELFNLEDQIVGVKDPTGDQRPFTDVIVRVRGYEDLTTLQLRGGDNFTSEGLPFASINMLRPSASYPTSQMNADGIRLTKTGPFYGPNGGSTPDEGKIWFQYEIKFEKKFFDSLPPKETEYKLHITAVDFQEGGTDAKQNTATMHIATTDAAVTVKAPVQTEALNQETNPMAVLYSTAVISGKIRSESAAGYGVKYRKKGTPDWISVPAEPATAASMRSRTRAVGDIYSVTLTGLEPGTTYEYKAYEQGYDNCNIYEFTTESAFVIPNASFEEWGTYKGTSDMSLANGKDIVFPGTGSRSFWDSGNPGAAAANDILTDKSTDIFKSGSYSAKLVSKECGMLGINKFAAGNVFAGEYVKTDGTDGVLKFGRPYNGSHPKKLVVYANYRPAVASGKGANDSYIASGALDQGQIYVALTTEQVDIRTKSNDRKLFDKDDSCVLAYGQVTWTANFGPDGALEKVEIPLEYYERAKTTKAKYLVIVASASKFGDYFSGGPGSVMYLDDFELVYE